MSTWGKWLIGILGGVVLIAILAGWYLSRRYKPILKDKISEKVYTASKGLYRITLDDLELSVLTGSARFMGIRLEADTTVYGALKAKKLAPATRFDLLLNVLEFDGLSVWKLIFTDKVHIGRVVMDSLKVGLVKEVLPYASADTGDMDLYAKIKDSFEELQIDAVELKALNLEAIVGEEKEPLRLKGLHARVSEFLLSPQSAADSSRIFYSKRVEIEVPKFAYALSGSPYRVAFDRLNLDSRDQSALLLNIRLEPKITKAQYFQNDRQNKALIALQWDTLRVENWDMGLWYRQGMVHVKKVFLKNGSAVFRKDRRYQKDNVNKIGEAPHQQIMKLKQRIAVDTVYVDRSLVQYRQMNASGSDEGMISFENARGIITNVTNDTTRLRKDGFMRADMQAMLMGKGRLHAVFGFDMLRANGAHSYKGSLGAMGAPEFNRILTPLLNLEIASGNIRSIRFDMKGNDGGNCGEFRFDYDDFKVNVRGDLSDGKRKKKGILSFLVNKFVINDSNPDANEVYHVGAVQHTRVPEYSHFKSIWKSFQDGIAQCAGIDAKWLREKM